MRWGPDVAQESVRAARGERGSPAPRLKAILELFAGCARFSGARFQTGLRLAPPIDAGLSPDLDVTDRRIFREVFGCVKSCSIWSTRFWAPCANWCMAKSSPEAPDDIHVPMVVATLRIMKAVITCNVKWALEKTA
eukprot:3447364-Pyramimonas_sp.AAC.1